MSNTTSVYGQGWAFPPAFSPSSGVEMVKDTIDIQQSLYVLLSTQLGERIMRPAFGNNLQLLLFRNINSELVMDISAEIYDCILKNEPRVEVKSVDVTQDESQPSRVNILISYNIRASSINDSIKGTLDLLQGQRMTFSGVKGV